MNGINTRFAHQDRKLARFAAFQLPRNTSLQNLSTAQELSHAAVASDKVSQRLEQYEQNLEQVTRQLTQMKHEGGEMTEDDKVQLKKSEENLDRIQQLIIGQLQFFEGKNRERVIKTIQAGGTKERLGEPFKQIEIVYWPACNGLFQKWPHIPSR